MCNFKILFLCFFFTISIVSARSILGPGGMLQNEEMLVSDNNRYFLRLEKSGDLVLYDKKDLKNKVWSTRTEGTSSKLLFMQHDGNLALYMDSIAQWHSNTASVYSRDHNYLTLEDYGVLNIRNKNSNRIVWTSNPNI
ncbi:unnamed protein product [Chironomus riparius]|uniref:Bulb-type lectin domain-containing protein n=1 Tax=Chironomus riparius TaxID=315576 RepID=A0A9N9RKF1_9DIPT|nr:unnamed protein product [Chironomus riparius]